MHKKPKKTKRMMDGGMAGTQAAMSRRPNPMGMQPKPPSMPFQSPEERNAAKLRFINRNNPGFGPGERPRFSPGKMPYKTPPRMQRDIGFGNGVPYPPGFVPGKGPYPAMGQPPKTKTLVNPEAMQGLGGLEGGTSGTQGIGGAVSSMMRGGGLARKGVGVALAKGGAVKKEKGYTEKERKGMRRLFEEHADPYAGDVTGGSSVTPVKKPKKRMAAGGIVGAPARSYRDMRAGAGGGTGRIQKTKIAGRGR